MEAMENTAIIKDNIESLPGNNIFLPSDVAREFGPAFLDEDLCRYWIIKHLHPEAPPACPSCQANISDRSLPKFWEGDRIYCNACGKFFTALTGTFLSGCHLNFSGMFLLAAFLGLGIRSDLIADKLSLSVESVRLWQKKYKAIELLTKIKEGD